MLCQGKKINQVPFISMGLLPSLCSVYLSNKNWGVRHVCKTCPSLILAWITEQYFCQFSFQRWLKITLICYHNTNYWLTENIFSEFFFSISFWKLLESLVHTFLKYKVEARYLWYFECRMFLWQQKMKECLMITKQSKQFDAFDE